MKILNTLWVRLLSQWHYVHSRYFAAIHHQLQNIFKLKLHTHYTLIPHFPLPPDPEKHHPTLCFYEFDYSRYHLYVESYSICPFTAGLSHLE